MRENFWHFHRHLAGMRALPRLTVHAQLHREIMWIGNFISSYNPGPQWAECIDSLAEAEHSRLHLPPLNVACGNVIENHVPAELIMCSFQASVAALKQGPHLRRNQRFGQTIERAFVLHVTKIKRASRMQINHSIVGGHCADPRLLGRSFKCDKSHKSTA